MYKILDRFELLYPTDSRISDLRRAYIDKEIYSIFRLANADEELRKAILEKNLHSIFRSIFELTNDCSTKGLSDDLKKAVCNDNIHSIYRLLDAHQLKKAIEYNDPWAVYDYLIEFTNSQFAHALKVFLNDGIDFDEDCLSRGQLKSKIWLINELQKTGVKLGTVFLCAGWYGILATMLFESKIDIGKIRSFDIDESTEIIAEIFNKPWVIDSWKFKSVVQDIHDIDFEEHSYMVSKDGGEFEILRDSPDTVINTSCEHIEDFETWYNKIPSGKLLILQCNNFHDIDEHVNTHDTLESFTTQTPLSTELYSGKLDLGKYKRFMRIGYR